MTKYCVVVFRRAFPSPLEIWQQRVLISSHFHVIYTHTRAAFYIEAIERTHANIHKYGRFHDNRRTLFLALSSSIHSKIKRKKNTHTHTQNVSRWLALFNRSSYCLMHIVSFLWLYYTQTRIKIQQMNVAPFLFDSLVFLSRSRVSFALYSLLGILRADTAKAPHDSCLVFRHSFFFWISKDRYFVNEYYVYASVYSNSDSSMFDILCSRNTEIFEHSVLVWPLAVFNLTFWC